MVACCSVCVCCFVLIYSFWCTRSIPRFFFTLICGILLYLVSSNFPHPITLSLHLCVASAGVGASTSKHERVHEPSRKETGTLVHSWPITRAGLCPVYLSLFFLAAHVRVFPFPVTARNQDLLMILSIGFQFFVFLVSLFLRFSVFSIFFVVVFLICFGRMWKVESEHVGRVVWCRTSTRNVSRHSLQR